MEETLFIINPASARGATPRSWAEAKRELERLGIRFSEQVTARAGEATDIARRALQAGAARIVAVGGDGTLSEVVNGYFDSAGAAINPEAAVGLLPSGTGSDFRRSIGIDSGRDAIAAIASGKSRVIDAVRAVTATKEGASVTRSFINVATFGLGGDASAFVNGWRGRMPKWVGGRARFIAAALRALDRYKLRSVEVTLDGELQKKIESNLLVVANGRFAGGGMMLAPNALLDDGLLDVVLTDGATRLDVIRELPRINRGSYLKNPKVKEARAREVLITTDEPMAIDIDGEMVGYTPARMSVLPAAVRFII
ncbi:MAG TPA: diacylglycerol kinase family protein [Blastocatellia bacterium]|nr:diacylglycerol kinase family protein [Blastocatellia bacterium]